MKWNLTEKSATILRHLTTQYTIQNQSATRQNMTKSVAARTLARAHVYVLSARRKRAYVHGSCVRRVCVCVCVFVCVCVCVCVCVTAPRHDK